MSEDTTTTDAPVAEGVDAASTTAPAQPETTESAPAEVSESKTAEPTNTNDDELTEWASKKGLEVDLTNPDVAKLAKMQREAEKKMHESTSQASELKNIIKEEAAQMVTADDGEVAQMRQQLQVMQANQAVNDFYASHPEAREYDADMAKLVQDNPALANAGLEGLYDIARARRMDAGGSEQLKREGGKEALQDLALKQKAAASSGNATSGVASAPSGITVEDVSAALARGDKAWIFEHKNEIDAL